MTNTTGTITVIYNPADIMRRAHSIRKTRALTLASALRQAWYEAKRAAAATIASYHQALRTVHTAARRAGHATRASYEAWLLRLTGYTSCLRMPLAELADLAEVCASHNRTPLEVVTAPKHYSIANAYPAYNPSQYASDEEALAVLG